MSVTIKLEGVGAKMLATDLWTNKLNITISDPKLTSKLRLLAATYDKSIEQVISDILHLYLFPHESAVVVRNP